MKTLLNKEFKNAPSLSGFIDWIEEQINLSGSECFTLVGNYNTFLKTPLTLSMLIPCYKNGQIMEKPDANLGFGLKDEDKIIFEMLCDDYQKAMEQVYFTGFEVEYEDDEIINFNAEGIARIWYKKPKHYFYFGRTHKTISDLIGQPINQTFFNEII